MTVMGHHGLVYYNLYKKVSCRSQFELVTIDFTPTHLAGKARVDFPFPGNESPHIIFAQYLKVMLHETIGNDDFYRTLLQNCLEWLQHCSNIAKLCCAKNRRCESSCVT